MEKGIVQDKLGLTTIFKYINSFFLSNLYFMVSNTPLLIVIALFQGQWTYGYLIIFLLSTITLPTSIITLLKIMDMLRKKEDFSITKKFFEIFKQFYKKATAIWLIEIILFIALSLNILYFQGGVFNVLFLIMGISIIIINISFLPLVCNYNYKLHFLLAVAFVYTIKRLNITITNGTIIVVGIYFLMKMPLLTVYFIFSLMGYGIMYFSNMVFEDIDKSIIKTV